MPRDCEEWTSHRFGWDSDLVSTPTQRPEGDLLERLRNGMQPALSARAAAKAAGLSPSRWTQIVRGYKQETGGIRVPVRAPADTLARMARVVGATPEQLRGVGRADAADEMEAQSWPEYFDAQAPARKGLGRGLSRLIPSEEVVGSSSAITRVSHALATTEQIAELLQAARLLQQATRQLANAADEDGIASLVGVRATINSVIQQLNSALQQRKGERHVHRASPLADSPAPAGASPEVNQDEEGARSPDDGEVGGTLPDPAGDEIVASAGPEVDDSDDSGEQAG